MNNNKLTVEQVETAIRKTSSYTNYDGCTFYTRGLSLQGLADELNFLISAQGVQIVHCRDCTYSIDGGKRCDNAYLLDVEPDGFCAWGEKR